MPENIPSFEHFHQEGIGDSYSASTHIHMNPPLEGDLDTVGTMVASTINAAKHQSVKITTLSRVGNGQHVRLSVNHGLAIDDTGPQLRMLAEAIESLKKYHAAVALGNVAILEGFAPHINQY